MLTRNFNIPFVFPVFKATYRCRIGQVLVLFPLNPVSHVFLNQRWENNRKSCNLSSVTFPSPQPGVRQQGQGGRKSVAMSRTWLPGNSEENCWDAPTAPAESFLWLGLKNRGWVGVHKFFSISEHAGSLFLAWFLHPWSSQYVPINTSCF